MSSDLEKLAADLEHASHAGAAEAGAGAVRAGAWMTETDLRLPGQASVAVAGLGGLRARVGRVQRRGVYQESAPAGSLSVNTAAVANEMAEVAAAIGADAVSS